MLPYPLLLAIPLELWEYPLVLIGLQNSDMKKTAFIIIFLLIPLLFLLFNCTDYNKRQCEEFTGFYNDVQFDIIILSKPVAEPNYYRFSVRDLASKKDSILSIDRELVSLSSIWNIGDTLTKNRGNTIVELRKRDSILNTRKFLIEWTCKGTFINGEDGDIWERRLASHGLR
ncbi:hypothetical protein D7322_28160 [Sphingobacterium puteale]|uniref:Uncharacterized protein n=2 Tax=Sphingobacterium puteale TaxID=2420510 RepID=A0A420VPJ9_9SPHI|nr:hypothetical protein D7322_28160 [Sphingobacterium puteale]